jgi:hypothetical protein
MSRILVILVVLAPAITLISMILLNSWAKLRRESSFLTAIASTIGILAAVAYRFHHLMDLSNPQLETEEKELMIRAGATIAFGVLGVPFVIKVYRAWTGVCISPDEKAPGATGIRTWLSSGNMIFALLISVFGWLAFNYQFLGIFTLLVGALLIQPLVNTLNAAEPTPPDNCQLSDERQKVLSLLESGRITSQECADLLNALGATGQAPSIVIFSPRRRLLLTGAGLTLFGFFLPWFSINPGKELERQFGQATSHFQGMTGMETSGLSQFASQLKTPTVHISGGDVERGLGWLVLLLGLGTASLPYVASTMDSATQRMVSSICLGIGGIVIAYLISQNFRFLNAGIVLVLAGYIIEFLGIRNHRTELAK